MNRTSIEWRNLLVREWQEAYAAANEKLAPLVEWKGGWFIIGSNRYRRSTLEEMTFQLRQRANAAGR